MLGPQPFRTVLHRGSFLEAHMQTHVKVVAVGFIVLSALGVLAAFLMMLVFGGAAGIVGAAAEDPDAAIALPLIGITGTFLTIFLFAISLPGLITGFGLLSWKALGPHPRHRPVRDQSDQCPLWNAARDLRSLGAIEQRHGTPVRDPTGRSRLGSFPCAIDGPKVSATVGPSNPSDLESWILDRRGRGTLGPRTVEASRPCLEGVLQ
jgi:hypothetical protein